VRDGCEEVRGYIQCEETNAATIPGDDVVGSLEEHTNVLSVSYNNLDPVTGRAYVRRKVRVVCMVYNIASAHLGSRRACQVFGVRSRRTSQLPGVPSRRFHHDSPSEPHGSHMQSWGPVSLHRIPSSFPRGYRASPMSEVRPFSRCEGGR